MLDVSIVLRTVHVLHVIVSTPRVYLCTFKYGTAVVVVDVVDVVVVRSSRCSILIDFIDHIEQNGQKQRTAILQL